MGWLIQNVLLLIGLGVLILVGAAILAPLESLGWWAGWSGRTTKLRDLASDDKGAEGPDEALPEKSHYVVYLSGIGVASADGLAPDEFDFIDHLAALMPDSEIITDVFPYSVTNNPLTGHRLLQPLWRKARSLQEENPDSLVAMLLINIRNTLQVLVSADPRYGPIYGVGVAQEIARSLARHGYRLGSGKPVFLIGFSGGGQVSVGCATYLSPMIEAPVFVVSVGGVLTDDLGIKHVKRLTHLYGTKDPVQKIGQILWSGRWAVMPQSAWNRAVASKKVEMVEMGPMAHNALGGYYDVRVSLPDGETFCAATAAAVRDAIRDAEPPPVPSGQVQVA
jgi:hypothetical protein